jgi:hypothetical protein
MAEGLTWLRNFREQVLLPHLSSNHGIPVLDAIRAAIEGKRRGSACRR